jgi:hypothetical protein
MTGTAQLYSAPFSISSATTIKYVGMWGKPNQPSTYPSNYGFQPSPVSSANYTGTLATPAATPVLSPGSSSFATSLSVSISDATVGATIYYTTDGTVPTTSSTVYSGAFGISASTVVKAMAIKSGYSQSATATATYISTTTVSTPTFSPPSGTTFTTIVSVSISDLTPSSTIYYTTDGSTPTTGSTVYSGPLTISATTTVKAIAAASGLTNSAVGSATYSLVGPTVTDTPSASPAAGTYFATQSVALSDATSGATICYTTDGVTTPAATTAGTCSTGTTYSTAISVSSTEIINAIGTKSGLTNSPVASFSYLISTPTPSQRGNIDYTQIKVAERLGPGNFFQMANVGTYSAVNTATPCNSTNEGATAFVTDSNSATYGATISGGGSNKVHALCNGTAWIVD